MGRRVDNRSHGWEEKDIAADERRFTQMGKKMTVGEGQR